MSGGGGDADDVRILAAPAKLTRSLRVVGVRADGYHLLDAEMIALELADELTFGPGPRDVTVSDATPAGGGLAVPVGPDNLAWRALDLVGRQASVRILKRIPAGAGLGGGSADAAAVLRWAGIRADRAGLELAARLGSDVPFCLAGGRARVGGAGERLEPLAPVALDVTLLLVPLGVPTPAVYRRWDELGGPSGDGPNDLEGPALDVEPRLAAWRDCFGGATGRRPVLAGSGSTWFVEGAHHELVGPFAVPGEERPGHVIVTRARPSPDA